MRKQVRKGCFAVPMVHSTFLIDLRKEASRQLAFHPPHPEYSWAFDDIIVFAFSARMAGIYKNDAWIQRCFTLVLQFFFLKSSNFRLRKHFHPLLSTEVQMFVCNKETYGYLPVPLKSHNTLQDEADSFLHTVLEVNGEWVFIRSFLFTFASNSLFPLAWNLLDFYFLMLYLIKTSAWVSIYHLYHFCIHLPFHCVVRNPPVMPSKYIRVPRKQPDKLGFDEVSIVWCEDGVCKNGPLFIPVLNASPCC